MWSEGTALKYQMDTEREQEVTEQIDAMLASDSHLTGMLALVAHIAGREFLGNLWGYTARGYTARVTAADLRDCGIPANVADDMADALTDAVGEIFARARVND